MTAQKKKLLTQLLEKRDKVDHLITTLQQALEQREQRVEGGPAVDTSPH
jgi:phage shock protein A